MKKRSCFIDPPGLDKGLNIGLGYLCSAIKARRGSDVEEVVVYDFHNSPEPFEEKLKKIRGYDFVGISIKSYNVADAVEIAKRLRKHNKLIVAGGVHVTITEKGFFGGEPGIRHRRHR